MAVIYREITGTVKNSQGDLLPAGTLKVKPRGPIIQGSSFIAPRMASVAITDGEFTLSLAAPSMYEFLVISDVGETLWNFQSPLVSNTSKPISLAELWTNRNDTIDPDEPFEITRVSGDTYNLRLWLVDPDTGAALDLNEATQILLTVDEREEPDDESTVVFQLVGQVIDPDRGIVDFPMTANQADNIGEFFYNVTVSDEPAPVVYPSQTWTPSIVPVDGSPFDPALDGSDFWMSGGSSNIAALTYATQDDIRCVDVDLRGLGDKTITFKPIGATSTLTHIGPTGVWEFEILAFITVVFASVDVHFRGQYGSVENELVSKASLLISAFTQTVSASMQAIADYEVIEKDISYSGALDLSGWVRMKCVFDFDAKTVSVQAWNESGSAPIEYVTTTPLTGTMEAFVPQLHLSLDSANGSVMKLAEFRWEQIG